MDLIGKAASTCKVAGTFDSVYHSECVYSFHNPFHDGGILVNLQSFSAVAPDLLHAVHQQQEPDCKLYLRIQHRRVKKKKPVVETADDTADASAAATATAPVTKLGVGVQGGFALEEDLYDTEKSYSVVLLGTDTNTDSSTTRTATVVAEEVYNEATKNQFPMQVSSSVDALITHAGQLLQSDVKTAAWEDSEQVPISKFANNNSENQLPFVENGFTMTAADISNNPNFVKCQKSGDTENVWLNLSTGYMGGGRKQWDGSGGSNGALDHYNDTGCLYPLVVKLGTISCDANGNNCTADCYSYDATENGPVQIPNLAALLAKRGIQVKDLQKTVKSTAELEVELNANYAFDAITEGNATLEPVVPGPGLQGLVNLGNSCYMNSILQVLCSVPEFCNRYGNASRNHVPLSAPAQAPNDLLVQTKKVASALTNGTYCKPSTTTTTTDGDDDNDTMDPRYRLVPRMFKHVVGKDHVDFKTAQQQDAAQFLQYYLELLDQQEYKHKQHLVAAANDNNNNATGSTQNDNDDSEPQLYPTSHLFGFRTVDRLEEQLQPNAADSSATPMIKYRTSATETIWSLRLPMDQAVVPMEEEDAEDSSNNNDVASSTPNAKKLKSESDDSTSATSSDSNNKKDDDDEPPVPVLELEACLQEWAAPTTMEQVRWSHLNDNDGKRDATNTTRLANFPRYLLVQAQRYTLGDDWQPKKLQVRLQVPDDLDLTKYKSAGPQPGEALASDDDAKNDAPMPDASPALDEGAIGQLMDMGFSLNACKRALTAVGGSNVEAAMGWVFEHNTDPDFNDPLPEPSSGATASAAGPSGSNVDEGVVETLVASLGCFTADQVRAALGETNGAADRAADWLFSHMDDLDGAIANLQSNKQDGGSGSATASALDPEDGPGLYELTGMVSHIGNNTGSGHYVAHIKKNGRWIIFNDDKVAVSANPPKEHAFVYLFQRKDTVGGQPLSGY